MATYTDTPADLVINRLSRQVYDQLSATGRLDRNQLYLIDDPEFDCFGKRLINVADPIDYRDGVTVGYADTYYVSKAGISAYVDKSKIQSPDGASALSADLGVYGSEISEWSVTVEKGGVKPGDVTVYWNSAVGTGHGWCFRIAGASVPTGDTDQASLEIKATTTYSGETVAVKATRRINWTLRDRLVPCSVIANCLGEITESSGVSEIAAALVSLRDACSV